VLRISASRLVDDVHHDQQRFLAGRQRLRVRERSDGVFGPIRRPDNRVEHRTSLDVAKGRIARQAWQRAGLQVMLIGSASAAVGFAIGHLVTAVTG
jgi:hypothetical protein